MQDEVTTDLRFSIVPHWIIKHDISDRALRLYSVLAGFADSETNQAFPGRTRLSKDLRCSLKSVDRAVSELEAIGAIRKKQRVKDGHYQSSLYTVVRIDPASGVTPPRVTDDATPRQDGRDPVSPVTHITRTTEQELKNNIAKKATRMPADWQPDKKTVTEWPTKWPTLSLNAELEAFTDHHTAKGSTFKDWDAAFRSWCRNAVKWQTPAQRRAEMPTPGPGRREWVKDMHMMGEHWACEPGEFGCK
jgi:hypothetical protein